MRHFFVPAMIAAGLALAQPALSATAPAAAPAAKTATITAAPTNADPLAKKRAACEKTWTDQKKHTGKHKAFVAACVAKG